ncbi:MAG: T9SS type A sorting domain-containing protein [Elusimicrobiota bacterium]
MRPFTAAAVLAALASLSAPALAQLNLNPVISAVNNTLTWSAVVDPSTSATVSYAVFSEAGQNVTPCNPATNCNPANVNYNGSTEGTVVQAVPGVSRIRESICFEVVAYDVLDPLPAGFVSYVTCHEYLHNTPFGNGGGANRVDGAGTQLGYDQTWTFTYDLDADSYVTLLIYPPLTKFQATANGPQPYPIGDPNYTASSATVIGGFPANRSGEGDSGGGFTNSDTWDGRNNAGKIVADGIYYAWFSVTDADNSVKYQSYFAIPVDFRFTAFTTTPLTPTNAVGDVNYNVTSNANVRVIIANPGTLFTVDSSSNVQALDPNSGLPTMSTSVVVSIITGQRFAGANSETWNGTNQLGVAVSTGLYAVGISATDASGNPALNLTGNNGPVIGSIPNDRIPSQVSVSGTAPTVSSITVGGAGVSLTGGTPVTAFNSIVVTLSAAGGSDSVFSLAGPCSPNCGGNVTGLGTNVITFSSAPLVTSTGSYTISVTPYDPSGTVAGTPQTIQFNLVPIVGPTFLDVTIGSATLYSTGAITTVGFFTSVSAAFSSGAGTNTSFTLRGPNLAQIPGAFTPSGTGGAVTFTPAALATLGGIGTYSLIVNPLDATNTYAGPSSTTTFKIAAGQGPSVTGITIAGVPLALGGVTPTSSFTVVSIALNAAGGSQTSVALNGPDGLIAGSTTAVGTTVTYVPTAVVLATGAYTIQVNPYDSFNFNAGPVTVTSFTIAPPAGPSVTAITVGGSNVLRGGASVGSFSEIFITLGAAASTVTVTLTGPDNAGIPGTTTLMSGTTVTFTPSRTVSLAAGAYTLTVIPVGTQANAGATVVAAFNLVASGTNANFSAGAVAYPNPVKTAPAKIQFTLGLASTVTIDIYTLTGQRVLHQSNSYPASPSPQTFLWQLVNDAGSSVANGVYLVHVAAQSASGTDRFSKKILVVK